MTPSEFDAVLEAAEYPEVQEAFEKIADLVEVDVGGTGVGKPLVEALTRINEISVIDEDMGCAVNWAGDALTHARTLGL